MVIVGCLICWLIGKFVFCYASFYDNLVIAGCFDGSLECWFAQWLHGYMVGLLLINWSACWLIGFIDWLFQLFLQILREKVHTYIGYVRMHVLYSKFSFSK